MKHTSNMLSAALCGLLAAIGTGCVCCCCNTGNQAQQGAASMMWRPGGSGGNFLPVQGPGTAGTPNTFICGVSVGRYFDLKAADGSTTQTPDPSVVGFTGYLYNMTTGASIPNNKYKLYWLVNSQTNGCATNMSSPYIGFKVTGGLPYHFTAYFKSGVTGIPALTDQLQLLGNWTY